MMKQLQGFLDQITIKALQQAEGCTNSRVRGFLGEARSPLTGTMWYDRITGTIYDFGDGIPYRLRNDQAVAAARVYFDERTQEPLPELYGTEEMTPALETALASIRKYQEIKDPLANLFN